MARILVIAKTPLTERLSSGELTRLRDSGVVDPEALAGAAARHAAAMAAVRAALAGHEWRLCPLEAVRPGAPADADLVLTVGGDGTVLTAATLTGGMPFLTVNSDPIGSVGHYTRCRAETLAAALAAWRTGRCPVRELARLDLVHRGVRDTFLNDCLFANPNPAAVCRHRIETPDGASVLRSSGVWVSTATGSTGAIRSAGAQACTAPAALLFKVREPFAPPPGALLEGRQIPPAWLRLAPAAGGAVCWLDGPMREVPVAPGEVVVIEPSPHPLRLLEPGSADA